MIIIAFSKLTKLKNPVALVHGKGASFQNSVNTKYLDKTVLFVHTNALTSCLI